MRYNRYIQPRYNYVIKKYGTWERDNMYLYKYVNDLNIVILDHKIHKVIKNIYNMVISYRSYDYYDVVMTIEIFINKNSQYIVLFKNDISIINKYVCKTNDNVNVKIKVLKRLITII